MANPLQPKAIKVLEKEYDAFVLNVTSASKSGLMDLVACVPRPQYYQSEPCDPNLPFGPHRCKPRLGIFYGFEIKWKNDQPSELQKQKINACIDAGGRAYFIRSIESLRNILNNDLEPIRYELRPKTIL